MKGERKGLLLISPAVTDENDCCTVPCDFEEHGHGEVEVWVWRVAPTAIIAWKSEIGRAKVSGCYDDGRSARVVPSRIFVVLYLETRATAQPIVEQCRA